MMTEKEKGMIKEVVMSKRVLVTTLLSIACVVAVGGCGSLPQDVMEEVNRPVSKEFVLGPEDVLEIAVWRNQDLSRTVIVRPDGMISLPLIGDIKASGLTATQVGDRIAKRLTEFKENPSVSVSVKEVNSYFIYVLGEVGKAGKYPLKSYASVLQGISLAGGFTPFASKNRIVVVRTLRNGSGEDRQIRIPLRYDDLVAGKGEVGNLVLMSGDTIVVP